MNSCCLTELSEGHLKKEECYKPTSEITINFSSAVYLWDVDSGPEELQVFPHLLWFEFRVEDGQLCEHAHVSALQPQRRLQHGDQLLEVATVL